MELGEANPDRVDEDVCGSAGAHGGEEVGCCALGAVSIEDTLSRVVGGEVDGASGDDADKHGADTLPEAAHAVGEHNGAGNREHPGMRSSEGARLQARLDNFEWACQASAKHATSAASN